MRPALDFVGEAPITKGLGKPRWKTSGLPRFEAEVVLTTLFLCTAVQQRQTSDLITDRGFLTAAIADFTNSWPKILKVREGRAFAFLDELFAGSPTTRTHSLRMLAAS